MAAPQLAKHRGLAGSDPEFLLKPRSCSTSPTPSRSGSGVRAEAEELQGRSVSLISAEGRGQGVPNASRLCREIQKRGYAGALPQVKKVVRPCRTEERERVFVRFETAPGEQAQMDWVISATGTAGVYAVLR